jgi:hypothetical protein
MLPVSTDADTSHRARARIPTAEGEALVGMHECSTALPLFSCSVDALLRTHACMHVCMHGRKAANSREAFEYGARDECVEGWKGYETLFMEVRRSMLHNIECAVCLRCSK